MWRATPRDFGVGTGTGERRHAKVKARKDAIVADSVNGLESTGWATWEPDAAHGARQNSPGRTRSRFLASALTAPQIFLNLGGRPTVPDWPGIGDVPYLTNVSMMDLDVLPSTCIVVGGSYIGLEFAQMYRRFGARSRCSSTAPRLVAREDADISDGIADILATRTSRCISVSSDFASRSTAARRTLTVSSAASR